MSSQFHNVEEKSRIFRRQAPIPLQDAFVRVGKFSTVDFYPLRGSGRVCRVSTELRNNWDVLHVGRGKIVVTHTNTPHELFVVDYWKGDVERVYTDSAHQGSSFFMCHISQEAEGENIPLPVVASASSDKSVKLWDLERTEDYCLSTLECAFGLSSICYSPQRSRIFAGAFYTGDGGVAVFDVPTSKLLQECSIVNAHTGSIITVRLVKLEGRELLLTGSWSDHVIKLWDLRTDDVRSPTKIASNHSPNKACAIHSLEERSHLLVSQRGGGDVDLLDIRMDLRVVRNVGNMLSGGDFVYGLDRVWQDGEVSQDPEHDARFVSGSDTELSYWCLDGKNLRVYRDRDTWTVRHLGTPQPLRGNDLECADREAEAERLSFLVERQFGVDCCVIGARVVVVRLPSSLLVQLALVSEWTRAL